MSEFTRAGLNGDADLHRTLEDLSRTVAQLQRQLGGCAREDGGTGAAPLVSPQEFGRLTGFSVHTIRDWCEQGLLPAQKIGNRWRMDRNQAMMALKNLNRRRRKRRAKTQA